MIFVVPAPMRSMIFDAPLRSHPCGARRYAPVSLDPLGCRAKTRLLALLRRLGYNYDGKTHWTEAHKRYLRHLTLPDAAHNRVLEDNLTTVDFHVDRIARLEEAMLQLLEDWQRKPLVEALMAFKGFKLVAAMVTVSEIGTFSRFEHPKKLMAFLGLVPTENSSGNKKSRGGISKCGN